MKFTTSGEATLEGELLYPASGLISPVSGLALGDGKMNLGLWNVAVAPEYLLKSFGELMMIESQRIFVYSVERKVNYSIVTNPDIRGRVTKSYSILCDYVRDGKYIPSNCAVPGGTRPVTLSPLDVTPIYEDDVTKMSYYHSFYYSTRRLFGYDWPNAKTQGNKPAYYYRDSGYPFLGSLGVAVNILVTNTVSIDGKKREIYSSKTFIPYQNYYDGSARPYGWTREELRKAGFMI